MVLFHATLQLSAWRLEQRALQRVAFNFAHISAECIRLLRDRVENEMSEVASGVSDQTISAVATLAAIEVPILFPQNLIREVMNETDETRAA